jgi:hypothetical protein
MGKYYGAIGYAESSETKPGVWTSSITEKKVFGDVIINTKKSENPGQVNDNVVIHTQISFLADPYALLNFHLIKYATYLGNKWRVTIASVQYPRLVLTLGGVYNE